MLRRPDKSFQLSAPKALVFLGLIQRWVMTSRRRNLYGNATQLGQFVSNGSTVYTKVIELIYLFFNYIQLYCKAFLHFLPYLMIFQSGARSQYTLRFFPIIGFSGKFFWQVQDSTFRTAKKVTIFKIELLTRKVVLR